MVGSPFEAQRSRPIPELTVTPESERYGNQPELARQEDLIASPHRILFRQDGALALIRTQRVVSASVLPDATPNRVRAYTTKRPVRPDPTDGYSVVERRIVKGTSTPVIRYPRTTTGYETHLGLYWPETANAHLVFENFHMGNTPDKVEDAITRWATAHAQASGQGPMLDLTTSALFAKPKDDSPKADGSHERVALGMYEGKPVVAWIYNVNPLGQRRTIDFTTDPAVKDLRAFQRLSPAEASMEQRAIRERAFSYARMKA